MKGSSWRKALFVMMTGGMVFGASGACNPLASEIVMLLIQQVVLSLISGALAT